MNEILTCFRFLPQIPALMAGQIFPTVTYFYRLAQCNEMSRDIFGVVPSQAVT